MCVSKYAKLYHRQIFFNFTCKDNKNSTIQDYYFKIKFILTFLDFL